MRLDKEELEEFCKYLEHRGYRRFSGHYKNEDFGYWKGFRPYKDAFGETERRYQIAILIYDFSKYDNYPKDVKPISMQFEYVGHQEEYLSRMDLSVCDDRITIDEFEDLCDVFYRQIFVNHVKKNFEPIEEEEESI